MEEETEYEQSQGGWWFVPEPPDELAERWDDFCASVTDGCDDGE